MPIYAYRCTTCGYAQDVLQKISDPVLTVCPNCGAATYAKQVTAAGFQLKGSGWYVTDFRGGNQAPKPAADGPAAPAAGGDAAPAPAPASGSDQPAAADKPSASADKPAASAPPSSTNSQ
ncbi:MAG: zinc ribbon domain-containing protein [Proteobacteria bacterium]|nr:zinc ribbon domain-containing protein [Pseudomonadota bacterium]